MKVNTRYSRALLGVPFIPYLQNLLPKVIPLTANSSASLHKQNLAMSELVELLGTEEALPYRMALPLSPAISLSSFIGTLSVFSVLPQYFISVKPSEAQQVECLCSTASLAISPAFLLTED